MIRFISLTESQRGVYMECIQNPESTMYNIPLLLPLPDVIDRERFVEAMKTVMAAHPSFFVTIGMNDGEPVMVVDDLDIEQRKQKCTINYRDVESKETAISHFLRPFDFEHDMLFRMELCHSPEGDFLLLDVHHIIFDGTSYRIFLRDLIDAYDGKELPVEEFGLFHYAEQEIELKGSDQYKEAQQYFKEQFGEAEFDSSLLPDLATPDPDRSEGCLCIDAPEGLTIDRVDSFNKEHDLSNNTLFNAAFAYTLTKFNGQKAGCYTTATNGRSRVPLTDSIGMFVKTIPLRIEIDDDASVVDYLRRVKAQFYEAKRHDLISFGELVENYGISSGISFVYQGTFYEGVTVDGTLIHPLVLPHGDCSSDIIFEVCKFGTSYRFLVYYRKQLYSEQFVENVAQTYFRVLEGMLACDRLSDITLVSEKQRACIDQFNRTENPYDQNLTVDDFLTESIRCYPDETVLSFKDRSYTYAEFDRLTKNIASYIHNQGLGTDDIVAILTPRCDYMIIAAWGVIRAGAAFQALDPTYPAERINYMIADSKARLLIADESLFSLVDGYECATLYIDEMMHLPDVDDFHVEVRPTDAITMIYTSGTTGKPKGCVLENRNLVALYQANKKINDIDSNCRMASYSSFGFDAGVHDIIVPPMSGGTVCIIPDEIRLDFIKIDEFLCQNSITHINITTQIGRMLAQQTTCSTLRSIIVGGEKLVPFTPPTSFGFINAYGPCETMLYVSHHVVTSNCPMSIIGTPNDNTKLYVVDNRMRLLPPGAVGELCIAGWQVGRGYLGLPEKTSQVFVPNPFSDISGYDRIYRTGDMVRLLPDGNIEFIGRQDSQVKIRGFRIELTEVEEVVRRFEGIIDATVTAFDDPAGGKYLAAYVVSDTQIDVDRLNSFILEEKPPYMVPAVTMQLDAIPYTQNRKVNRRALPVPKRQDAENVEKPETEVQQSIFDIAKDVLGHDDFGVTTNLFMAGMTSMTAFKFNYMISKAFDCAIKISDLKTHPTIKQLEQFLNEGERSKEYEQQTDYPLMQNQMGVFVESGMAPDGIDYNIPMLFRISDELDIDRLRRAMSAAIDAHPYMKTLLTADDNGYPRAMRNDNAAPTVEIVEVDRLPAAHQLIEPFTLLGQPLYRARIYITQHGRYLFLDVHHIISDGTSMAVLIDDINNAYSGSMPAREALGCYEASLDEASIRSTDRYTASAAYYDHLLNDCPTDCLPARCPESQNATGSATYTYRFAEGSSSIIDYCRRHHLTMNAFFNAAFSFVLSEFLHTDDVTYCTIYNGRNDSRYLRSFGMFVKTLPVRTIVQTDTTVVAYVRDMQEQLISSMSNDSYSFAEISNRHSLRSDIFFNYQGDTFCFATIGDRPAELQPVELALSKAPLTVEVFLNNGTFRAEVTYRTDHYCREFVSSFVSSFITAANSFVTSESLSQVSILSAEEALHIAAMNATEVPFRNVPAQRLFEEWAERQPDAVAVKTKDTTMTYSELNSRANRLAHSLLSLGVQSDDIVSVILPRTDDVATAEIGILKAGAAFLPMLPDYPDDRLDYCITDSSSRYVITTDDIVRSHPLLFKGKSYEALTIDELMKGEVLSTPELRFSPSQLAYCIYTSGSTGTPKGVMIEQHNLTCFVQTGKLREVEAVGTTILCTASISFDMSVAEIFFTLTQGNTVYIASDDEIHNFDKLLTAFDRNGVDFMIMTPSFAWSLMSMDSFESVFARFKGIVLGAEAFPPALLAKFKLLNPDMLVQNGYGPTECTMSCSAKNLNVGDDITIGGPQANTKYYVMDDNGHLLPRYAVGELIIGGEGVCRGYVNLPDRNAASFLEIEGVRAYHSGDLIRINRNDEAEFGGRKDNQVKLRGFRVELDEVESVMSEFDGVSQCKVIVRNNGSDDFMAAFFTADKPIDIEELTTFMRKRLTYYMVPAAIMQLDKMPMTANGKLDKKALPEISPKQKAKKKRKPKKSLEERILDLFRSALKIDECYVDDNFFEIGGTSLSASSVVMQLKSDGYKIEYQDIFDNQTAAELAEYLERHLSGPTVSPVMAEPNARDEEEQHISEVLQYNTMNYAAEVERHPLGDVLLTGATGFLGNHILKELMDTEDGKIYCLLRKGSYDDVATRLKSTLFYYFEDSFDDVFNDRIIVIEGDITDNRLSDIFKNIRFDTLINCAACVKHFANDDSIEFVNVHGVENLISLTKEKKARMIQISTTSVPGVHDAETYRRNLRMTEDRLFVIDDMNNQYGRSKYKAELLMLNAIKNGMDGKIIRVGNLMGRHSDGEFQTNMRTNAFINGLRGFVAIGKCPISHSTDPMSFSPVDSTARAVVLLSGTNSKFTAFNADSRTIFDEMKVIESLNKCGMSVVPVKDEEYYADFYRMMGDPETNSKVSALLTNDRPDVHMVMTDNRFTANVLYRIGFAWPFIDDTYLEKVIRALDSLGFFLN